MMLYRRAANPLKLVMVPGHEWTSEFQGKIRDFGYSSHGNHNSMSLLRTAELYGGQDASMISSSITNQPQFLGDADRKYRELVRQLPSQACIEILIQTFFSDINWQYDPLDEESFREDLDRWGNISYSDLQGGFGRLTPGTIVFPALLFQVLAQALLFHPPHDDMINSLIIIADMTFHDLAAEYSDAGAELLAVLGKKDITLTTVQAGLLRASFLKSSGKVVEAWHALGATIRDAQEIGLHTGRIMAGYSPVGPSQDRQNISLVGHKIWVVLHIWDVHMAVVLGRPITTDLQIDRFARTIEDDERRRELFSHWQTETDLPRPFDIILAGFNVAYRYFKDIHQLEHNGATLQDYPTVERIHTAINMNSELLPSWCRLENPDTKFDRLPGCQWLPVARETLSSLIHLVLLALHRTYIFSVANSRTEAIKAGICILRAQERLFEQSQPHQCKVFNPVYASFDAIVLLAALCLVFPNEDHERRAECIHIVERGMQRLGIIGQSNSMAKSAHGVVCSLYRRLSHRLDIPENSEEDRASLSKPEWIPPNSDTGVYYGAPSELSFGAVLPPRPIHDLFYDHISSTTIPFMTTPNSLPFDPLTMSVTNSWNFEGAFSDASFWNLMNQPNN
ncbi:transcriptional regulator family: Fungal Specific TF [Penicillium concentricum]|uniref:Transcriptional regulator family: Fungal Specific TF n=1 Tax=Penicillium concentricum TaxID=293559 RepID=A0A9W9SQY4_9EURO|nr:transcriptional regulator family: Fungal Specific TF [Penicillium concentricum]KAJ5383017.1 transcriptional regulator family: Fungal Specific TF [Penicillium concentricum]